MTTKFFGASEVISKAEFVQLYRSVSLVTNLLLVPFGFSDQVGSILGDDKAAEEYTTVFQQIEDVVAKAIFRHFGYDDDRIIASMHQYVGVEQDKQLLEEIKSAPEIIKGLLERPSVVSFDFEQLSGSDYNAVLFNSATANSLFSKVKDSLLAVHNLSIPKPSGQLPKEKSFSVSLQRDEKLFKAFGIKTSMRIPSPILALSGILNASKDVQELTTIVTSLLDALTVTQQAREEGSEERKVTLTHEQFNVILDMFFQPSDPTVSLENLRTGVDQFVGNMFQHPMANFVQQLNNKISEYEMARAEKVEDNVAVESTKDFSHLLSTKRYRDATESLLFVQSAQKKLEESRSMLAMGDPESAIEALSDELLDLLDFDDDNNEEEEGEEVNDDAGDENSKADNDAAGKSGKVIIPAFLKVQLLMERAKMLLEIGRVETALEDINRALVVDPSSSLAFGMRSQARMLQIQRGIMDVPRALQQNPPALLMEIAEAEASSVSSRDIALHLAAEDAMLGFMLSGSSDIAQAGIAEELSKEAVRSFARGVFHARRNQKAQEQHHQQQQASSTDHQTVADNDQFLPKAWFLTSYLSSYPLLTNGLKLYGARTWHDQLLAKQTQLQQQADVNDIDESDVNSALLSASLLSTLPPDHLLDEDSRHPGSYLVREQDATAYALLTQLTHSMEALTYEDVSAPVPAEILASTSTTTKDSDPQSSSSDASLVSIPVTADNALDTDFIDVSSHVCGDASADDHALVTRLRLVEQEKWRLVATGVAVQSAVEDTVNVPVSTSASASANTASAAATVDVRMQQIMHWVKEAAVLAGVQIDPSTWTIGGFDFEVPVFDPTDAAKFMPKYSESPYADGFGGGYGDEEDEEEEEDDGDEEDELRRFMQHMHQHQSAQHKRKRSAPTYGHSEEDDEDDDEWEDVDDEEGDDGDEEDQWEDVDDDAEDEEKKDEDIEDGGDEEDFQRLAAMISEVPGHLQETTMALSPAMHMMENEEASEDVMQAVANAAESMETQNYVKDAQSSTTSAHANGAGIDRSDHEAVSTEDVDISIDDLLDALEPLVLEDRDEEEVAVKAEDNTVHSAVDASEEADRSQGANENAVENQVGDTADEDDNASITNPRRISKALQARLLSLIASLVYLAGDAMGAAQCLEASLALDPSLNDTRIKLGALLVDLDEATRAYQLLQVALQVEPQSAVVLLHLAQWAMNESDFSAAHDYLRRANRLLSSSASTTSLDRDPLDPAHVQHLGADFHARYLRNMRDASSNIHSNVYTLLAVNTFRQEPTAPEHAVRVAEEGLSRYPRASTLLLSAGEIHAQAGDMVKGLQYFARAALLDPALPLPFISAARVYQQLGQFQRAHLHLQAALRLDDSLAMTYVDLSQLQRQQGDTTAAIATISRALRCAKQVSEIRDVLSTKYLARLQQQCGELGLLPAIPPALHNEVEVDEGKESKATPLS